MTVTLIGISHVLDRLIGRAHSRDNLFAFRRYDTGVIDSVRDRKRRSDLVNMKEGERDLRKSSSFCGSPIRILNSGLAIDQETG